MLLLRSPPSVAAPDAVAAKAGDGDRGDASEAASRARRRRRVAAARPLLLTSHQDSTACSSSSVPASGVLPEAVVGGNAAAARRMDTSEVGGGVDEGQGEATPPVTDVQVSSEQDAQRARVEGLPYEEANTWPLLHVWRLRGKQRETAAPTQPVQRCPPFQRPSFSGRSGTGSGCTWHWPSSLLSSAIWRQ